MARLPRPAALIALLVAIALAASAGLTVALAQDTGWTIREFDAHYTIQESGDIDVVEDILVDFGGLQRHGIFRLVTRDYDFDGDFVRRIDITNVVVDDGELPRRIESVGPAGSNIEIKIGDPDVFVSGVQRYRISYTLVGALNPQPNHDELYLNVTGSKWPIVIENASATVEVANPGIRSVICFEGPVGSTAPCDVLGSDEELTAFRTRAPLQPGSDFTIVVALGKDVAQVGAPLLIEKRSALDQATDFLGVSPLPIAAAAGLFIFVVLVLGRMWWLVGRDRWYGHNYYDTDKPDPTRKPLFGAHEPIVVEYQPPQLFTGRRLRPAEIGLLLDERADTLDVSATIVDLAVRGYLTIEETMEPGSGLFGGPEEDYKLTRLLEPDDRLLPFERTLMRALFKDGPEVKLSDLKEEFHKSLAQVKKLLYKQAVEEDGFFPRDPERVRMEYRILGVAVAVAGGLIAFAAGAWAGVGLVPVPVVIGGVLLVLFAGLMPRRSADGRQMYRRCLGLRLFMTAGDQARQRFAEQANIFEEYLPYAIVFKSARRWAEVFDALGLEPKTSGWYVGRGPFVPMDFATSVRDFSSSVSTVMASTPGGSGGSGFSGGFSGGGAGGGGGGSW